MAEPAFRVGMVGYGYFAKFHLNAWRRLQNASLVALAETDPQRRAEARRDAPELDVYDTVEDMLTAGSVDILDVATPPSTHLELIRPVLGQVCAVICQKPFCDSLPQAQALAEAAKDSSTLLIVHENFRFQPWYREIRQLLQAGRLGRVIQARFCFRPGDGAGPDAYLRRQPYFRDMKQFLIRETGIHWVDVFRFLFGEPVALSADLFRTNPAIAGEDSGSFTFQMPDGARITFDGNRALDHAARNRRLTMGEFLIEGTSASLLLSGDGIIEIRDFGSDIWQQHPYSFEDRDFGGDCVYLFQRHVLDHLSSAAPLENTASDYLKNLAIQDLIYRSSHEGERLALNEVRDRQ
uniref:Gfo/Idh/MocA family protein n=1 Tax=Pararhizobium sp. IMCC3301 TaxID=3067904 RepID=UPI002741CE3F|nr:Gfo/Idh/MocA family oxidoreductase [Pararhizobium sp. IMCC3301]